MSNPKFAFIFPGQGSQSVGMLAEFADSDIVKQTFEQASSVLQYDLHGLIKDGPAESLNETQRTQPALLASSIALWRLWLDQSNNKMPNFVAGHSLGEYSALVAANVLQFEDAIKLVEQRGEFMQQAVPAGVGKMAAIIGLDDELIIEACEQSAEEEIVSPVNFNSLGQVVIAGNCAAVERAMEACTAKGAKKVMPLAVSVPSHCALMKPAAEELKLKLNTLQFRTPTIPLVNNVDVAIYQEAEQIKDALIRQLYSPVRWTESMQFMVKQGITELVECGPGNVLSGLAKRIDRSLNSHKIKNKDNLNQLIEVLS